MPSIDIDFKRATRSRTHASAQIDVLRQIDVFGRIDIDVFRHTQPKNTRFCLKMRQKRVGMAHAYRQAPARRFPGLAGCTKMSQAQVTITKTPRATKAPKAPKADKATTAPVVTAPVTAPVVTAPVTGVNYRRAPTNATLSGDALKAHTQAFLRVACDMRPGVPLPLFTRIVGSSALTYHKNKGNLRVGPTGAPVLTEAGALFFSARKPGLNELQTTYETMMRTGVLPDGMVYEKNPPVKI
jgi:hypothetical protein